MTTNGLPRVVRLMLHVAPNRTTGCWDWTGSLDRYGYARFRWDNDRKEKGHRAAYELIVGPIPDGAQLDHLCRNRQCVNPRHLDAVSQSENIRRGERAQQTHCKRGHEFTDENTYVHRRTKDGGFSRKCRQCARSRMQDKRSQK